MDTNTVNNENVTVRELYQLIDSKISLVNSSILRLETKFDNLESGRLSSLEKDVATVQGRLMIIPVLISIAFGIAEFLAQAVIFNHK